MTCLKDEDERKDEEPVRRGEEMDRGDKTTKRSNQRGQVTRKAMGREKGK